MLLSDPLNSIPERFIVCSACESGLFLASCTLVPGFMPACSWLHASFFWLHASFFWLHARLFLASCQLVPGFMHAYFWLHARLFLAS